MPAQNSQTLNVSTTGTATIQFATTAPNWLNLSPASGSVSSTAQPITVSLTSAAAALGNGSYPASITVYQTGPGAATLQPLIIPVTLNVGNQITINPADVVNLNYQSGQTPPSVSLAVGSTVGSIPFTVTNIQPAASWLQPSVAPNATTPGTVNININPANLTPGPYTGTFQLASTAAGVSPQTVTVNLTVSSSPSLTASPTSLNFAYQAGTSNGPLPAKTVTLSTNGGPVAFTIDPVSQSWIQVSANGTVASQAQPATLTITVNPNSPTVLTANNYTTNVVVRPLGIVANANPVTIPVNLLVSNTPLLITGNAPNPFNYQIGGTLPQDQTITIASSSNTTPVDYTVSDKPSWLDIAPGSGTTSLTPSLTLHVNQGVLGTLGTGSYPGTVTLRSNLAGNSPVTFPVTLNVAFTPSISTNIGGLTFNYQTTSGQQPGGQFFTVNSTGSPLPVGVPTFTSTNCGGAWINVASQNATTPATIVVNAATAGITAPSTCTGTISIPSGTQTPLSVPVTLNVSAAPLLNVTAPELSFSIPLGSLTIQQKTITLGSTDPNTPLNYNIASDQPWLTVVANAASTATSPSATVFVNPAVFTAPGPYTGTLTVTNQSANPAGSQPAQRLLVTVTVTSNVTLTTNPANNVNLSAPAGGAPVTAQLALNLSSGSAGFTATASSAQGWLKLASTPSGTPTTQIGGTAPATITVIADPTSVGLAPNTYVGSITITAPGLQNSPQNVTVTLTVGAAQTIVLSAPSLTFNTNVGQTGTVSNTFNLTSTGGNVNFTIAKGTSGCDAISVSPTSGTTGTAAVPVTVTLNQAGLTTGSIACTLTVSGPQGSGIAPQTFIVNVSVGAVLTPQLTAVVNAASYAPGPVAPGEVITIYGSNLGPTTLTTYVLNANNTFATTVADTTVTFDNTPAPILYVRNDQLSVVVPFEVAGRATTNLTIKHLGQTSAALQMQVANFVPGMFTLNVQGFGQGAIINENGTVNGPNNPAPKGSIVAIYLTGAGTFTTNVGTGTVVTSNPTVSAPVSVSIGGQPTTAPYTGAAGTAIAGLYQFNVVVPKTLTASGPQPVVLTVGGQPAQSNVTVFVQ